MLNSLSTPFSLLVDKFLVSLLIQDQHTCNDICLCAIIVCTIVEMKLKLLQTRLFLTVLLKFFIVEMALLLQNFEWKRLTFDQSEENFQKRKLVPEDEVKSRSRK